MEDSYFKMYLGAGVGFVPPKKIEYFRSGKKILKQTKPLINNGEEIYEPIMIAEFSKKLIQGLEIENMQIKLINFFQNFFLTQTNGLKLQPFFVTAPNPLDGLEKVVFKYSFDNVVRETNLDQDDNIINEE